MTNKVFIHPDILIQIKQSFDTSVSDHLDKAHFEEAKRIGTDSADEILKSLFESSHTLGHIESHFNTERLTSGTHKNFREEMVSIHYQRQRFTTEYEILSLEEDNLVKKLVKLKTSLFKIFYKKKIALLEESVNSVREKKLHLQSVMEESYVNLRFEFEILNSKEGYSDLCSSFLTLKSSQKIWDVIMTQKNLDTKAAAGASISRNEISIDTTAPDLIKSSEKSLHFQNFNGGDFYFNPNFILYFKNLDEIAIIDYSDFYLHYEEARFLEEKALIPADTKTVGETWYRVNKDGSPDKRFVDNYKIPIVQYGALHFKTKSGINDLFYISNAEKAKHFYDQFCRYKALISQR